MASWILLLVAAFARAALAVTAVQVTDRIDCRARCRTVSPSMMSRRGWCGCYRPRYCDEDGVGVTVQDVPTRMVWMLPCGCYKMSRRGCCGCCCRCCSGVATDGRVQPPQPPAGANSNQRTGVRGDGEALNTKIQHMIYSVRVYSHGN